MICIFSWPVFYKNVEGKVITSRLVEYSEAEWVGIKKFYTNNVRIIIVALFLQYWSLRGLPILQEWILCNRPALHTLFKTILKFAFINDITFWGVMGLDKVWCWSTRSTLASITAQKYLNLHQRSDTLSSW